MHRYIRDRCVHNPDAGTQFLLFPAPSSANALEGLIRRRKIRQAEPVWSDLALICLAPSADIIFCQQHKKKKKIDCLHLLGTGGEAWQLDQHGRVICWWVAGRFPGRLDMGVSRAMHRGDSLFGISKVKDWME